MHETLKALKFQGRQAIIAVGATIHGRRLALKKRVAKPSCRKGVTRMTVFEALYLSATFALLLVSILTYIKK